MKSVLEVWFPGPVQRPTYYVPDNPIISSDTRWEYIDLQKRTAVRIPPQSEILNASNFGWQSVDIQLSAVANGYASSSGFHDEFYEIAKSYDLIIVHWQHPFHVAWAIGAIWEIRKRQIRPNFCLWGRHTSYGRDVSADLRNLHSNALLSRLFDAIIYSNSPACLSRYIKFFLTGRKELLDCTLLSTALGFVDYAVGETNRYGLPDYALKRSFPLFYPGDLLSGDRLSQDNAEIYIDWQAPGPSELSAGLVQMEKWLNEGKSLILYTPIDYPWLSGKDRCRLRFRLDKLGANEIAFQHYSCKWPVDICDRNP